MNIKINTVKFTADPKLLAFVEKKVEKLDTFFDEIINADVILKVETKEKVNNKIAELKILSPKSEGLFAKKQANSFEEAVDLAVDAMKKQVRKLKEKRSGK